MCWQFPLHSLSVSTAEIWLQGDHDETAALKEGTVDVREEGCAAIGPEFPLRRQRTTFKQVCAGS